MRKRKKRHRFLVFQGLDIRGVLEMARRSGSGAGAGAPPRSGHGRLSKRFVLALVLACAFHAYGATAAHRTCPPDPKALATDALHAVRSAPSAHTGIVRLLEESGTFVTSNGSGLSGKAGIARGGDAVRALFPDQASYGYFLRYLSELSEIDGDNVESPTRTFPGEGDGPQYRFHAVANRMECTLVVLLVVRTFVDEGFGVSETSWMFEFAHVDGAVRLISSNAAG